MASCKVAMGRCNVVMGCCKLATSRCDMSRRHEVIEAKSSFAGELPCPQGNGAAARLAGRAPTPESSGQQIRDLERGFGAGERRDRSARTQDEPGLVHPVHRIAIDLVGPA